MENMHTDVRECHGLGWPIILSADNQLSKQVLFMPHSYPLSEKILNIKLSVLSLFTGKTIFMLRTR